jgi:hypothetical protein
VTNISTIDGHVLLPHQADWSRVPEQRRVWRSRIESTLSGREERASVRSQPWVVMSYDVLPFSHVERARFEERSRASLKACKLAVPHWGRGAQLLSPVEAENTTVSLDRDDHGFRKGDHVFIQPHVPHQFDEWDVAVVAATNGPDLTFARPLAFGYAAGTMAWPLLYGRPSPEAFTPLNDFRSRYQVAVQFDRRQVFPTAYETFGSYDLGVVSGELDGGEGWFGPWAIHDGA